MKNKLKLGLYTLKGQLEPIVTPLKTDIDDYV